MCVSSKASGTIVSAIIARMAPAATAVITEITDGAASDSQQIAQERRVLR